MKRKFIILIFLFCLVVSTSVFATDTVANTQEVLSDLGIAEQSYILNSQVVRKCIYYI